MPSNTLSTGKCGSKPNIMRYLRIQGILESELGIRKRMGPKDCTVTAKHGVEVCLSKLAVTVAESLHDAGRDSYKIPKHEIVDIAAGFLPDFNSALPAQQSTPSPTDAPALAPTEPAPRSVMLNVPVGLTKDDFPVTPAGWSNTAVCPSVPSAQVVARADAGNQSQDESAKTVQKVKRAAKQASTDITPEALVKAKSAKIETKPVEPQKEDMPEDEIPPEKQPLRLPKNYDPSRYPHYSVQTTMYSLLLSAMSMSETHERYPGFEVRQQKLESLLSDYHATVEPLNRR